MEDRDSEKVLFTRVSEGIFLVLLKMLRKNCSCQFCDLIFLSSHLSPLLWKLRGLCSWPFWGSYFEYLWKLALFLGLEDTGESHDYSFRSSQVSQEAVLQIPSSFCYTGFSTVWKRIIGSIPRSTHHICRTSNYFFSWHRRGGRELPSCFIDLTWKIIYLF